VVGTGLDEAVIAKAVHRARGIANPDGRGPAISARVPRALWCAVP
jgi:hypothetical protein